MPGQPGFEVPAKAVKPIRDRTNAAVAWRRPFKQETSARFIMNHSVASSAARAGSGAINAGHQFFHDGHLRSCMRPSGGLKFAGGMDKFNLGTCDEFGYAGPLPR